MGIRVWKEGWGLGLGIRVGEEDLEGGFGKEGWGGVFGKGSNLLSLSRAPRVTSQGNFRSNLHVNIPVCMIL